MIEVFYLCVFRVKLLQREIFYYNFSTKAYMKYILRFFLLFFSFSLFSSQITEVLSIVQSDQKKSCDIVAMPRSVARDRAAKDMISYSYNQIRFHEDQLQGNKADQHDAVSYNQGIQQNINDWEFQSYVHNSHVNELFIRIRQIKLMSEREQLENYKRFKATFLDPQFQDIVDPSGLLKFLQQDLKAENNLVVYFNNLCNKARADLLEGDRLRRCLQQQEQEIFENASHYQAIYSDMLKVYESGADLKWKDWAFALKKRQEFGQMRDLVDQRKNALVRAALEAERLRLQQDEKKVLELQKKKDLRWKKLAGLLQKKEMFDQLRDISAQREKDLEVKHQIALEQQRLVKKEAKKKRIADLKILQQKQQEDEELRLRQEKEVQKIEKVKADRKNKKAFELEALQEKQRQGEELQLQQEVERLRLEEVAKLAFLKDREKQTFEQECMASEESYMRAVVKHEKEAEKKKIEKISFKGKKES